MKIYNTGMVDAHLDARGQKPWGLLALVGANQRLAETTNPTVGTGSVSVLANCQ